ncbi:hypothetical protein [Nocardia goodfellowii]|uniref:Uncharacterized protein n=1 Tax=Nocardia goodfellowii TaxID=882446 RepID=A0ABS4QN55_9NOCA|nr:hypothetical protein [Nocardia goodfellowii]MBP2193139.1 hypothetical protein [Nocardia goodfellowii]
MTSNAIAAKTAQTNSDVPVPVLAAPSLDSRLSWQVENVLTWLAAVRAAELSGNGVTPDLGYAGPVEPAAA